MGLSAYSIQGADGEAAPVKIRMGWGIPAEEVKYVMMKRPDILKHYGKEYTLEWFQFAGTAPQATALAANGLDAATLASLSLAEAIDKFGLDVKVSGGIIMEVVPNFMSTWLVLESSGIKTIKDLKGKTVGINVYGASLDHIQRAILRREGLEPEKDVKILEISFGLMEATLRRGDIQCGAFPQPFFFNAMAKRGHLTAKNEGIGEWIGKGSRELGKHFGCEDEAVQVNDLEVPYHDPRGTSGIALVYATSPRGACHNQSDYFLVDIGNILSSIAMHNFSRQGGLEKAQNVAIHQD